MKYNILVKNLELTDELRGYVEKKLGKIARFYDKITHLDVDLSREAKKKSGPIYRAEVNLDIPGPLLRVVEFDYSIEAAIDKVQDKIIRQVKKAKGKLEVKNRPIQE
jgi:putative sigma-54 modulation protein